MKNVTKCVTLLNKGRSFAIPIPITFLHVAVLMMFLTKSEGRGGRMVILGWQLCHFKGMEL